MQYKHHSEYNVYNIYENAFHVFYVWPIRNGHSANIWNLFYNSFFKFIWWPPPDAKLHVFFMCVFRLRVGLQVRCGLVLSGVQIKVFESSVSIHLYEYTFLGQNHLLIDFVKTYFSHHNWFPKIEPFYWLISKLISLLPNQNA